MTHATEAGTTTGTRRYAPDYQGRDLWRRREVLDYLRISSPTLIRWSRRAQFPRPIRMGRLRLAEGRHPATCVARGVTAPAAGSDPPRAGTAKGSNADRRAARRAGRVRAELARLDEPESRRRHPRLRHAPRPVRWVWTDRIPAGMVSLAAGREGTGKSTMFLDRAARLTRGDLEGAHYGRPRSVVVAAAEDSWAHTVVPRLLAAGADLTRVLRVQIRLADLGTCELSLPDDVHVLGDVIRDHDVAMVVLDPLISRLSRRLDTHRDAEVRLGLEPLARVADETGAAVVGLIHVNKTATRDPGTSIMGSRGFVAVARAVMYVAVDTQDPRQRVLSVTKSNVGLDDTAGLASLSYSVEGSTVETAEGPATTARVVWTGVAARGVREILAAGQDHGGGGSARATADWLRSAGRPSGPVGECGPRLEAG